MLGDIPRGPLIHLLGGEQLAETCGMRTDNCDVITGMVFARFVTDDGEIHPQFRYAGRLICAGQRTPTEEEAERLKAMARSSESICDITIECKRDGD